MIANGGTLVLPTGLDWRVVAFTGGVSLTACILAGLAPGLHAIGANVNPALKEVRTGGARKLGKALVVAQLSISMVLLVGATLFVGTLVTLYTVDRGFRIDRVLTFNLLPLGIMPDVRARATGANLWQRLNSLPVVESASAVSVLPINGNLWTRGVQVEGYTLQPREDESVRFNVIAPKYFQTISTPLLLGRDFGERDTETSTKVAIVNQSFARRFFDGRSPLGRRVTSVDVPYESSELWEMTTVHSRRHTTTWTQDKYTGKSDHRPELDAFSEWGQPRLVEDEGNRGNGTRCPQRAIAVCYSRRWLIKYPQKQAPPWTPCA